MPRICSICRHEDREGIDEALLDSEPYRTIAARTGTSIAALYRHRWQHLRARLVNAKPPASSVANEIRAAPFGERFNAIKRAAPSLLEEGLQTGNHVLALQAMVRMEKHLEMEVAFLSKLSSRLQRALGLALKEPEKLLDPSLLTTEELRTFGALQEKCLVRKPDSAAA